MGTYFTSKLFCRRVALLILAAWPVSSDWALAQSVRPEPRYEVTGFRGARFGMTESDVRLSAKNSFGVDDGDMTESPVAYDGTSKLIVHVQNIDSTLGAGRIEYFFDHWQRRLFRVNVVWGLDPSNGAVVPGAIRLQTYFLGLEWAHRSVRTGVPLGDRSVLLFAGADGKNGAVSLILEGVPYQLSPNGTVILFPESRSRPKLTISYNDESNDTDVGSIRRGQF